MIKNKTDPFQAPNVSEPGRSLLKWAPRKGLILDAGCGSFKYTNFLKDHYCNINIISTDIVNFNHNEAKKNNFILSSIEYLPLKNNCIDFIFCFSVIQLLNDKKSIDELFRVMKKNSNLLITIPTKMSIFKILRDLEILCGIYKFPEFNKPNYHYYGRSDINKLILGKFIIIDIYGYGFNFIPRLINFLKDLFKRNPKKIKKSNNKKYNNINIYIDLPQFIKRYFCDFSYHYILILKRK